jgi:hypothetical protein
MWRSVRTGSARPARQGLAAPERAGASLSDDGVVCAKPLVDRKPHFTDLLVRDADEADASGFVGLWRSEPTGRPLGSAGVVAEIDKRLGRTRAPGKRARRPRSQAEDVPPAAPPHDCHRAASLPWSSLGWQCSGRSAEAAGKRSSFNRHSSDQRVFGELPSPSAPRVTT